MRKRKKIEESKRTIKFNLQFDHEWAIPAEFQCGEKKITTEIVSTLIANESANDLDDKDSKDELHITKTEEEIIEEKSEEKGVNIRKRKKIEKSKRTVNSIGNLIMSG